jgi:hypothetical protein
MRYLASLICTLVLVLGPLPAQSVGAQSAMAERFLSYFARYQGERVLRPLHPRHHDGVASVDLSPEIQAYGGGSARVQHIRGQVTRTLTQFPTVREVRIAVAGQTAGVLQP